MGKSAEDIIQLVNRPEIITTVMSFIGMSVNLANILGLVQFSSGFEIPP